MSLVTGVDVYTLLCVKLIASKMEPGASLFAQMVKNLPATQRTWVPSLGWEEPLEKGMATHSSILAWEMSWTVEPGRLQSTGLQRAGHDRAANMSLFFHELWYIEILSF